VPRYNVTLHDPSGRIGPAVSWKRLETETLLEYGNEVEIESDSPEPGRIRAHVTDVDNDAFFTNKVTVEPIENAEQHGS
jgi:hypothetical protein